MNYNGAMKPSTKRRLSRAYRKSAPSLTRANPCRKWSTIPKSCACPRSSSSISQSAVTLHRVAAFCFTQPYGSLKSARVLVRQTGIFVVALWRAKEAESGDGYTMKHIAGLYIVWLVAAGLLGISLLGPCMTFAYAQSDVQSENVITSPRGTFRIEREEKRNAGKGEFATTTFWITLAADPSQRVQLNEPVSDPDAWHFFISPDEQWICATVHEHSQLNSLKLYRCENGLQFKLVATEDEETEGPAWKFDKNDRVGPKDDVEADETGGVYNYFVAWSADSARLLVEKRVQEHDEKARKNVWFYHYFYFNLRRGELEHTKYLRTLSRRFRDGDILGNYAVPAFAEPLDALPPEKDSRSIRSRQATAQRGLPSIPGASGG